MPEFTPLLKCGARKPLEACAWLLPSPSCDEWLAEIAAWNVDQARLRFIMIPASISDASVVGVVIVVGNGRVEASPKCIPYGLISDRVYTPVDSEIFPLLAANELDAILANNYSYVWHPGVGLVAAEEKNVLTAAELIAPLRRGKRHWNRAAPGIAIIERLTMLAPQVELSFQQLLEKARDDIGMESDSLSDQPVSPDELGNGLLDKLGRAVAFGAGGTLAGLGKILPAGGEGGGIGGAWIDKLRELLSRPMNRAMAAQEHLRHKEISRLLHMLEQDPDKGLKFALPLNAAPHRGLAPPSNRLGARQIDFNLRRLGGGRPGDFWNIAERYRQQLLSKYRELANREMHLGRHRRAAYVFAELLGDFESAAMALKNGHHFREAAVVYRDRLKRPLEAAKCLESGGLWSEAIDEYANLGMHEKVGDLYTHLGDLEKAHEVYRVAADRLSSENDFLSSARLWDEKLGDQDQAIAELKSGWPLSPQAMQCVRSLFALLGRTGSHQAAERQIDEIVQRCPETKQYARSADVLAEIASGAYPKIEVRMRAGGALLQVVSNRLPVAQRSEASLLVTALSKLASHDRLLERDGRRFVGGIEAPLQKLLTYRHPLREVHRSNVGLSGCWETAAVVGQTIVAAGKVDGRIVMVRCRFEKGKQEPFVVPWSELGVRTDSKIALVVDPRGSNVLGVHAIGEKPFPLKTGFKRADDLPDSITVGSLTDSAPLGITRGTFGMIFAFSADAPVIQIRSEKADLVSTHHLPLEDSLDLGNARYPLPMQSRRYHLYIAIGRTLLAWKQQSREQRLLEFAHPICCMTGSAEHTRSRLVLGLDQGACVIWDPANDCRRVPFALDMEAPHVGINRGGCIIAASGTRVEVYDSKDGKLTVLGSYNKLPAPPIAVLCGSRTDQFAIATVGGDVIVFEI